MIIRPEQAGDEAAIGQVVAEAFAGAPHSGGTEAEIVQALRDAAALTISLVAAEGDQIVGHVAISPVTMRGLPGWFGLGPVAVLPQHQRQGIGAALIGDALKRLRSTGAAGCVVLGEPGYYSRFGFVHEARLSYRDVPPPYLQALCFADQRPSGEVQYHPAFDGGG